MLRLREVVGIHLSDYFYEEMVSCKIWLLFTDLGIIRGII